MAYANPSCYMVNPDGSTVNLGHLCGESSSSSTPPSAPSGNVVEAAPAEPVVSPSLSLPQENGASGTIYTPEGIAEYMNACISEGKSINFNIPEENLVSYCQCTIDSIQNTYTSQEFLALENTTDPYAPNYALTSIVEACVYSELI